MPHPLQKTRKDGSPYTRRPNIEAALEAALGADERTLVTRSELGRRQPGYLPTECLVHLVRQARRTADRQRMSVFFNILIRRCVGNLRATVSDELAGAEQLREEIISDLSELIAIDGSSHDKLKLDYYEINFDGAFAKLRIDRIRRHATRARYEEPKEEIKAASELDLEEELATKEEQLATNKALLLLADHFELLPEKQRTAITLRFLENLEVLSTDPDKPTVTKLMRVSDSMVRRYIRLGLATLRAALKDRQS